MRQTPAEHDPIRGMVELEGVQALVVGLRKLDATHPRLFSYITTIILNESRRHHREEARRRTLEQRAADRIHPGATRVSVDAIERTRTDKKKY